jgi:amino acid efflux transporter
MKVELERTIGLPTAVALYTGAVLGTGILVLPAVAAETAGPASIVAWGVLCLLSLPLALTFAALARREPVAGGFSAYIERAFGRRWGAMAGWLFLAQFPTGSVIAGLIAGSYLAAPLGLGRGGVFLIGGSMVLAAYALNLLGLRIAGAAQGLVTAGVLGLVVLILVFAVRDVRWDAFTPFAPMGWPVVGVAATQLFWAFVGWEAITPLAEEFRKPERDLVRASVVSVALVAALYLALAVVTIGTRAYGIGMSAGLPPFALMGRMAFGAGALPIIGLAGGVLTFLPLNAYVAGMSRLVYALAQGGDLPHWVGALHRKTKVPHRALLVMGALSVVAIALAYRYQLGISSLLPLSTSSFIATYVMSMAAAVRLLKGMPAVLAAVSLVGCLVILFFVGPLVLWLVTVALASVLYGLVVNRRKLVSPTGR